MSNDRLERTGTTIQENRDGLDSKQRDHNKNDAIAYRIIPLEKGYQVCLFSLLIWSCLLWPQNSSISSSFSPFESIANVLEASSSLTLSSAKPKSGKPTLSRDKGDHGEEVQIIVIVHSEINTKGGAAGEWDRGGDQSHLCCNFATTTWFCRRPCSTAPPQKLTIK